MLTAAHSKATNDSGCTGGLLPWFILLIQFPQWLGVTILLLVYVQTVNKRVIWNCMYSLHFLPWECNFRTAPGDELLQVAGVMHWAGLSMQFWAFKLRIRGYEARRPWEMIQSLLLTAQMRRLRTRETNDLPSVTQIVTKVRREHRWLDSWTSASSPNSFPLFLFFFCLHLCRQFKASCILTQQQSMVEIKNFKEKHPDGGPSVMSKIFEV